MEKMKKMVICETCGAEYDVSLVRCPYCTTAYAPAEEDEYMGQMDEIRKDLESHKEDGNVSLKKGFGKMLLIVVAVIAVILILLVGVLRMSHNIERNRSNKKKEEFLINQGINVQEEDRTE